MENQNMETLLETKESIKDSFNKIVSMLSTHIGNKYPETYFGTYKKTIALYLTDLPYEPISMFIKYIYSNDEYRNKIINDDETFFMNQTFDGYPIDQKDTAQIFMMKGIWNKMDTANKNFIKHAFKNLIERTSLYIDVLCSINKLKKNINSN